MPPMLQRLPMLFECPVHDLQPLIFRFFVCERGNTISRVVEKIELMSKLMHDYIMAVLRLPAFFDDLIPRQDHRTTINSLPQGCLIWHKGIIRIIIWRQILVYWKP